MLDDTRAYTTITIHHGKYIKTNFKGILPPNVLEIPKKQINNVFTKFCNMGGAGQASIGKGPWEVSRLPLKFNNFHTILFFRNFNPQNKFVRIYLQVFSSLGLKYEVETKEHDFLQFFKFFFFILMTLDILIC